MDRFWIITSVAFTFTGTAAAIAGIGPGLGLSAVAVAEFIDFAQPSAIACVRLNPLDFGPPPGCDDGAQPHNRTSQMSSLNSGSSTTTSVGAVTVYDFDYFQLKDWTT